MVHLVFTLKNTLGSVFLFPHSPDAWTSVTYCSNSCPWWMTSKVRLFIVSALSAWCCSLCSASVRSSVSKSLICWDSSSFHDSRSEMIWEGGRGRRQREWDRKKGTFKDKMGERKLPFVFNERKRWRNEHNYKREFPRIARWFHLTVKGKMERE